MIKIVSTVLIGFFAVLSSSCTTTTQAPGYTSYTTYIGYDDGEDYAPFYWGYQNGYDPTNAYWKSYRDNRNNWGKYSNFGAVGRFH